MTSNRRYVVVDKKDNVATVVDLLKKDTILEINGSKINLKKDIPEGHKFSLIRIPKGGYVIKYGEWIGRALEDIPLGDHVHVHNVEDIVDEARKR